MLNHYKKVKFKSKLLSIGKKDFVDRLQTSIFQFISVSYIFYANISLIFLIFYRLQIMK